MGKRSKPLREVIEHFSVSDLGELLLAKCLVVVYNRWWRRARNEVRNEEQDFYTKRQLFVFIFFRRYASFRSGV